MATAFSRPSGWTALDTGAVPVARALALGGDSRIAIDPASGGNSYGCATWPDPELVRFGSSTASTVGSAGFEAAARLLDRLGAGKAKGEFRHDFAARTAARIRQELIDLAGIPRSAGVEAILAASGTDAHLIFAQMTLQRPGAPWVVIMPDPAESGSGVPAALAGDHFAAESALGGIAGKGIAVSDRAPVETLRYAVRNPDGSARSLAAIDNEVSSWIHSAIAAGQRVLLVAIDVSKTGIVAPSPGNVTSWKREFGDAVEILVDACQFRLSTPRLAHYLDAGCAVAVTGSKFMGGPIFSGALLLPPAVADRLRNLCPPSALAGYCARSDWPQDWRARETLDTPANIGLLLRWEAALAEMRRFRAVPAEASKAIVAEFRHTLLRATERMPAIEPVVDARAAGALGDGIDEDAPTIFPFYLRVGEGGTRRRATIEETRQVYRRMPASERDAIHQSRFELGQPVAMGRGEGALRLSLSAPLIVEAQARGGAYLADLASEALAKAARLALSIA